MCSFPGLRRPRHTFTWERLSLTANLPLVKALQEQFEKKKKERKRLNRHHPPLSTLPDPQTSFLASLLLRRSLCSLTSTNPPHLFATAFYPAKRQFSLCELLCALRANLPKRFKLCWRWPFLPQCRRCTMQRRREPKHSSLHAQPADFESITRHYLLFPNDHY